MLRRGLSVSEAALTVNPRSSVDGHLREATRLHGDELHSLERESGLNEDAEHSKEPIEWRVIRLEACSCERTRILPVSEATTVVVRASSEIDDQSDDDQTADQEHF